MKKILKNNIWLCLFATALTGCSDFLSEYSQDMIIPKTVDDLNEILIGEVYMPSYELKYGMNSGSCQFFNLLDDDINTVGTSSTQNVGDPNYQYSVNGMYGYYTWQEDVRYNYQSKSYTEDNATWNDLYHRINIANIILDEIEELPHQTDADLVKYIRVKGETHFLRGQFYFILVNLYGDAYAPSTCAEKLGVPLKLTPFVEYDKNADTQFARDNIKRIYDQIVADLNEATLLLSASPQQSQFRLHRATWEAASLLLSRVYLYMQEWEKAEIEAQKVMKSNLFSLAPLSQLTAINEDAFLTTDNPEIIFSQGSNTIGGAHYNWSITAKYSDHCVSRDLYNLYAEEDARKNKFFGKYQEVKNIDEETGAETTEEIYAFPEENDSVPLSNKYKRGEKYNHISDVLALRMAEAYLNYAEACAMQSGKATEANAALNTLRSQRIVSYTAQNYSGEQLVTEVRNERRKELCFEGKRWFDLRRYAVCDPYPYSRDIIHAFNIYNDNLSFSKTEYYKLPAGDPAYTFSIPQRVLEFDKLPMPNNPRDPRSALEIENNDNNE